jgi:hypothetical protein
MKLTKQQLQKVIQEELAAMQQEGELEEGFLDRLFGKDKRSTEFVSDEEVKSVINNVINSITDLVRTASRQDNRKLADKAAELKRTAMSLSVLSTPSGTNMPPKPEEFGIDTRSDPRPSSRAIGESSKRKVSK